MVEIKNQIHNINEQIQIHINIENKKCGYTNVGTSVFPLVYIYIYIYI